MLRQINLRIISLKLLNHVKVILTKKILVSEETRDFNLATKKNNISLFHNIKMFNMKH